MVDVEKVCCMCGDIGFPDKLFHCNNCRNRFQHSYATTDTLSLSQTHTHTNMHVLYIMKSLILLSYYLSHLLFHYYVLLPVTRIYLFTITLYIHGMKKTTDLNLYYEHHYLHDAHASLNVMKLIYMIKFKK